jgi:hypothetical protein
MLLSFTFSNCFCIQDRYFFKEIYGLDDKSLTFSLAASNWLFQRNMWWSSHCRRGYKLAIQNDKIFRMMQVCQLLSAMSFEAVVAILTFLTYFFVMCLCIRLF